MRVGCFLEKYIRMRQNPNALNKHLINVTDEALNLAVPVIDDIQELEFTLLDLVEFYTDIDSCGAFKVEAFNNKNRTVLSSN